MTKKQKLAAKRFGRLYSAYWKKKNNIVKSNWVDARDFWLGRETESVA